MYGKVRFHDAQEERNYCGSDVTHGTHEKIALRREERLASGRRFFLPDEGHPSSNMRWNGEL